MGIRCCELWNSPSIEGLQVCNLPRPPQRGVCYSGKLKIRQAQLNGYASVNHKRYTEASGQGDQAGFTVMISVDDAWLARSFILMSAAKGRVSEESLLAEFEQRNIRGITAETIRRILSTLERRGLIGPVKGDAHAHAATLQGKKAAGRVRARLRHLMMLPDDRSGRPIDPLRQP